MSDHILKAFEAAFGAWTTTGYFKHKPTQHQLDGFRKGYTIAEKASADRITKLEAALASQAQQPTQEPIYQLKMNNGSWIDQERRSYEYNVKNGHETRIVYVAMQSQAQQTESLPIGDMRENGVNWYGKNPHAFPVGTKFFALPPAPEGGV